MPKVEFEKYLADKEAYDDWYKQRSQECDAVIKYLSPEEEVLRNKGIPILDDFKKQQNIIEENLRALNDLILNWDTLADKNFSPELSSELKISAEKMRDNVVEMASEYLLDQSLFNAWQWSPETEVWEAQNPRLEAWTKELKLLTDGVEQSVSVLKNVDNQEVVGKLLRATIELDLEVEKTTNQKFKLTAGMAIVSLSAFVGAALIVAGVVCALTGVGAAVGLPLFLSGVALLAITGTATAAAFFAPKIFVPDRPGSIEKNPVAEMASKLGVFLAKQPSEDVAASTRTLDPEGKFQPKK